MELFINTFFVNPKTAFQFVGLTIVKAKGHQQILSSVPPSSR